MMTFTFFFIWSIGKNKLDRSIWRESVIYKEKNIKAWLKISSLSP